MLYLRDMRVDDVITLKTQKIMPYISTENVKLIRDILKKQFPKFKFSVTCEHYQKVNVSIVSGPIDFGKDPYVNHYYIDEGWKENPEARDFLKKVYSIMQLPDNGGGHEDADYGFIPEYYKSISIGKWDRPYILKTK